MSVFGYRYYPLLDDYIQLDVYPQTPDIYFTLQLYRQRPLAALFDMFIWSKSLNLSFLIITLMHCASACLLIYIFNKCGFKTGLLFAAVFVLCPLNTESTYWISASGRIVTSVFFATLAAYCLCKESMPFYYVFFVVSLLFYEQTALFSFFLSLTVIICLKKHDVLYRLFFIGCLYVAYYLTFATGGVFGERGTFGFTPEVFKTFLHMLTLWGEIKYTGAGFIVLAVIISLFFCCDSGEPSAKGFLCGLIYTFFGIFMFMFFESPTVGLRNLFVPLIGIALMADSIFSKRWRKLITPILALFFMLSSATDLTYYRENYYYDQQIISAVAQEITDKKSYTVSGLNERNITTGKDFAQFIQGVGSSDWALTGAVRAYLDLPSLPYLHILH